MLKTALTLLTALKFATGVAFAQVSAFPGAEGAGMFATGGRGGQVYKVTNLQDDGVGSLRYAIEAAGPRTIIFEISGTIPLTSPLVIKNPNITIAGQTAPGDGITLRDNPLIVKADDVIIRYLRSRLGDENGVEEDAIWIKGGRRIILDHVSASWSVDETLSVSERYDVEGGGPFDVTVQWSIIAESLNRSAHGKGQHGFGSLIRGGRGSRFSFHHNLWASHLARLPRPGNYTNLYDDSKGAYFDFRNNVFYNWGGKAAGYNADKDTLSTYNFIANTYIPGPNSKDAIVFDEGNPYARAHFAGNAMNGVVPTDPWSLVTGYKDDGNRLQKPYPMPPIDTQDWATAYTSVLKNAGASLPRDSVDARIIRDVKNKTHRIIDSQKDVGGWPVLKSLAPPTDTDNDGMPDQWERTNGLNPNQSSDAANVRAETHYTNLELYLNQLVQ